MQQHFAEPREFMETHVSVDCVVLGFDGSQLNVLLVRRSTENPLSTDLKLPGSLIYLSEDADIAAHRVLHELTGIRKITLKQFKAFTSPDRTRNPEDVKWLEFEYGNRIDRLITIAYLCLTKISRKLRAVSKYDAVRWVPVSELPKMPFDHNRIVVDALHEIRTWVEREPAIFFELLPSRFTASELRRLYEAVDGREYDVRNFHKKIKKMDYVVPLEDKQENVSHRAARYYRFDKVKYNQRLTGVIVD